MAVSDWYKESVSFEEIEPDLSVDLSEPCSCDECDNLFVPKKFTKTLNWDLDRFGNEIPVWEITCCCPRCGAETEVLDKTYDVDDELAREFYIDTYGVEPLTEEEKIAIREEEYASMMSDYMHAVLNF